MSHHGVLYAAAGFAIIILLALSAFTWWFVGQVNVQVPTTPVAEAQTLQAAANSFDSNDFEGALKTVDGLLSQTPDDVQALISKAYILAQQASLEHREQELGNQALVYIDQALSSHPQNVQALTLKGYIYEIQQQYQKADALYAQALTINPDFAYALAQYGHSLQLQGKSDQAQTQYEKALAVEPTNPIAGLGMGKIDAYNKAYPDAINLFLGVATSTTNARLKAEAYYSASLVADAEGTNHLDEEASYVQSALDADPSYPQTYVAMSRMAIAKAINATSTSDKQGYMNESFYALDQALNLNPGLSIANLQLATNLYLLERYSDAEHVITQLPAIIAGDISLSATEKTAMQDAASSLAAQIQKNL